MAAERPESVPFLVVMVGEPGTGKSFFLRRLVALQPLRVVESDALRRKMFPEPRYTSEEHAAVFGAAHRALAERLARGQSVAMDATNVEEKHRKVLYDIAKTHSAQLLIVRVVAPPVVVRHRMVGRTNRMDPADLSDAGWEIHENYRLKSDPIPLPHFVVNTAVDLGPALRLVSARLKRRRSRPPRGETGPWPLERESTTGRQP